MHFSQVRNYIFYRSGNADIATDIAQETFVRIWEKQESIKPEKAKGLLFKIAGDLFISHYRKEVRSYDFFNHFETNSSGLTPEEQMAYEQLKEAYSSALSRMPEKQRTVFLLSRVENKKYREIAEMLGLSVKAVEKRMKGALDFLKMALKSND